MEGAGRKGEGDKLNCLLRLFPPSFCGPHTVYVSTIKVRGQKQWRLLYYTRSNAAVAYFNTSSGYIHAGINVNRVVQPFSIFFTLVEPLK
jgi:hypothetical protein